MTPESSDPERSGNSTDRGASVVRQEVEIVNKRGLHARAAARFTKLAEEFDSEILVSGNGMTVSGLSIMGLMLLAAGPGTRIEIAGAGEDSPQAVGALADLVEAGFDEN